MEKEKWYPRDQGYISYEHYELVEKLFENKYSDRWLFAYGNNPYNASYDLIKILRAIVADSYTRAYHDYRVEEDNEYLRKYGNLPTGNEKYLRDKLADD